MNSIYSNWKALVILGLVTTISSTFSGCGGNESKDTSTYAVAGSLSGLTLGSSVVLKNNGADTLTLTANGNFTFASKLVNASAYNVTVTTQPAGQICTVANASGTIKSADIGNVSVTCVSSAKYSVGGVVSGLNGGASLVLKNNSADALTLSANGAFTFPTKLAPGATYNVTVATQPTGQTCSVTSGSGTLNTANVTNVSVVCAMAPSTLAALIAAMKADMGTNEVPLLNAPTFDGWPKSGFIYMGSAARGDATPSWWKPDNTLYKSSAPWSAVTPWFVIYPGIGNNSTNTRIQVYDITLYLLDITTHQWVKVASTANPLWAGNYDFKLLTSLSSAKPRVEAGGYLSYKLNADSNPVHGGMPKIDIAAAGINPLNIGGIIAHVTAKLILDDPLGPDDRAAAKILISMGTDYYPSMTTKIADLAPVYYVPAAGASRFGLVGTAPHIHYFSAINPPGPVPNSSLYLQNGGKVTLTVDELAASLSSDMISALTTVH